MPLIRKTDTLNQISQINSETYSKIITAYKMPADNLTIEEAVTIGNRIKSILTAVDNLGKTLATLDKF